MRLRLLAAVTAMLALPLAARADVVFSVAGVNTDGLALRGTFTTNDALTQVVSFDILTPPTATYGGFQYDRFFYTVSAETLPSQYFRLDGGAGTGELQFYFANGLTAQGGTLLSTNSYENQPLFGNRFLSGTVTAVSSPASSVTPEPSSLALLGIGVLGVIGAARRRIA